jgi:hypothetical protein
VGGARGVWSAVTGHDLVGIVVVVAGVVIAEGPVELLVGLGGGVNMAFLGGAFLRGVVVSFALFAVTVHPVKFCVGLLLLASSFGSVNVRARREEVRFLKIPVGFLK